MLEGSNLQYVDVTGKQTDGLAEMHRLCPRGTLQTAECTVAAWRPLKRIVPRWLSTTHAASPLNSAPRTFPGSALPCPVSHVVCPNRANRVVCLVTVQLCHRMAPFTAGCPRTFLQLSYVLVCLQSGQWHTIRSCQKRKDDGSRLRHTHPASQVESCHVTTTRLCFSLAVQMQVIFTLPLMAKYIACLPVTTIHQKQIDSALYKTQKQQTRPPSPIPNFLMYDAQRRCLKQSDG